MRTRLIPRAAFSIFYMLLASFVLAAPARAQDRLAGQYRCVRVEAAGRSAPCQSPPLKLDSDGSYQIWGEKGTYEVVQGRWLVLSHSKRRGLGHVVNSHEIIFEYRIGNENCRVTFRRIYDPPAGVHFS